MLPKSGDNIAFFLSEDTLKIAEIKGSGTSAKTTNVVSQDIKGMEDAQLSKTIQTALKKFKTKSSNFVFVVPPSMTTTKNIEIPSTNPDEIKSIVSLQAGRHTPFSRDEIQIGYVNIGVYKSSYTKVLLVIVNRNVLKNQLGILEKAGVKVSKVLFAPEGIAGLYSTALNLKEEATPTGIIDVGRHSTDFIIVHKGLPITTRNIPVGKSQIAQEGDSAKTKLVDELKKTLESYQSEDIEQAPSQYLLTSDDEPNRDLEGLLKDKLSWQARIAPFLDCVKASSGALKQLGSDYAENSFLDTIAPAAMVTDGYVNLIPEEVQLQKSVEDQGREVFKAGVMFFILLVLVALKFWTELYFKESHLSDMKDNYRQNREEAQSLSDLSTRSMIVREYLGGRMNSLDVIQELYQNVPDQIYLTNILMDEDGNINVQGVSEIASLIFNLGTTLKESETFKSVEIKSTTAKKDRGKDVSAFEIALKLHHAEDDVAEAAEEEE